MNRSQIERRYLLARADLTVVHLSEHFSFILTSYACVVLSACIYNIYIVHHYVRVRLFYMMCTWGFQWPDFYPVVIFVHICLSVCVVCMCVIYVLIYMYIHVRVCIIFMVRVCSGMLYVFVRICVQLCGGAWIMCVVVHNYVYMIEFTSVYMLLFACFCTLWVSVSCSYVRVCMSKECVYFHIISVHMCVHVTG